MLNEGKVPIVRGYLLNEDDKIRRITIMRLMCDLKLDYRAMSDLLNIDFKQYFEKELESLQDLEEDGLITLSPEGVTVTQLGRLFIRVIAMRFDAYLPRMAERRFSKTI
jgi:oxygen-independent coproporphyrinogen-3 oxidase